MDDDSRTTKRKVSKSISKAKSKKQSSSAAKTFRDEWNLFWQGLTGQEAPTEAQDEFANLKLQPLTMPQIKEITRSLSEQKKELNQRLEQIQREIELNSLKMQSVDLVGGNSESTRSRLTELHDLGQKISDELARLDARLRAARHQEGREKIAGLLG